MDKEAWKCANPALGTFRSAVELERWAGQADRMKSKENSFRNLYLNQRVNRLETFVSASVWADGNREIRDEAFLNNVYGGLDLAETTDLCAFVYGAQYWDEVAATKDWHLRALFWKPEATLKDHEKRDRVPYSRWVEEGWIRTTPGIAVDYEFVARDIADELENMTVLGIAYDRYRFKNLEKKFQDMEEPVVLPFVEWGQGYVSMAPAMDAAEIEFLNKRIIHGGNPVMRMCAANAVVLKDPAGNRKLDKGKSTGRIDGMQALVQMIGLASLSEEVDGPSIYEKRGAVLI